MPVFGHSLFETVLEGLDREEEAAEEIGAAYTPPRGLRISFVGLAEEAEDSAALSDARLDWADLFDGYAPPPKLDAPPVWLTRLSDAEISEDLALDQCRGRRRSAKGGGSSRSPITQIASGPTIATPRRGA
ncbi:hypothetical protein [Rhizobium sp. G21]|uniref:hypothetical protein n=1 Tax=Rhizobium sp. G21 TaxID=2758439 RepID=UPI001601C68A|nr:hypothetical protein [Rhizobium sp. G21]MBB1250166.1 hypothetical protein [Rhizobium sp. G21]